MWSSGELLLRFYGIPLNIYSSIVNDGMYSALLPIIVYLCLHSVGLWTHPVSGIYYRVVCKTDIYTRQYLLDILPGTDRYCRYWRMLRETGQSVSNSDPCGSRAKYLRCICFLRIIHIASGKSIFLFLFIYLLYIFFFFFCGYKQIDIPTQ